MNKTSFFVVMWIVLAGSTAGCAPEPIATPAAHAAFALPSLIPIARASPTFSPPPTARPQPTAAPTASPSPAAPPVSTGTAASSTSTPSSTVPTAVPTAAPTLTPAAAATPTAAVPPGLYVTDLRIDPAPVRGRELKFYAQFLNTLESDHSFRWEVYIFRADSQRSIGETSRTDSTVPVGTGEQLSEGFWKLTGSGPCDYFYAQVGWFDFENKVVWFTTPGNVLFQKTFTLCPS